MRYTLGKAGIETDRPYAAFTGHHNHVGHRQVGKWSAGYGGMNCPCCTPVKPSILKVKFNRYHRRKAKLNLMKEVFNLD